MEDLNDPLGDRVMKNVPPMARDPLIRSKLWHKSSKYQFFEMPYTFFIQKNLADEKFQIWNYCGAICSEKGIWKKQN